MILAGNQSKQKVPQQCIYIEKPRWRLATKLIYVPILNKPAVQAFSSGARMFLLAKAPS